MTEAAESAKGAKKKRAKRKLRVYRVPSIDYPKDVVKKWNGRYVKTAENRRGLLWPIIYCPTLADMPLDCPCPMAVPISALDKGFGSPESDFELVDYIDGDGFVDGRNVYKRLIVYNRTLRERLLGRRAGETETKGEAK